MKPRTLVILNTLTFLLVLYVNILSSTDVISGDTVSDISSRYTTLITPAGYAFAIWGFIYFMIIGFIGFQWYSVFKLKDNTYVKETGLWFAVSNLANTMWIIAWVNEWLLMSVFFMVLLLISLSKLVIRHRLEIWDAPLRVMLFVWWPITFYFGWIILATVVNVSVLLVSLNLGLQAGITELLAIITLIIATIIYLVLLAKRNLREAALVGIWGFIAIAVKQYDVNENIAYIAIILALILSSVTGRHAWRNRETTPIKKIRRKEF
ncbi:MAG: hypothetical protein CVV25_05295 [Ignavibacteriae bacterium HGW-Ignavibacteriae-4]|jgi:hypothetical protein|nr:MAG: hypothetical protein CVV25_05295 [Ignavibacteriae bacterium HGW-Ignavibacteriae-4]